jgi:hypothetical protein
MGELNLISTEEPCLSKILTTGSSERLEKRGKKELRKIESEVAYLLRIIDSAPANYIGYQDIASAIEVALEGFGEAGYTLELIACELENRDRIDG